MDPPGKDVAASTATIPPDAAAPPANKKSKHMRYLAFGAIALALVAGVFVALRFMHRGLPDGLIQAN
jgi:hypothetical protein